MEVQELSLADYDRVVDLWLRAGLGFRPCGRDSRQAFSRQLASDVQTLLGILDDGVLVGVVMVTHDSRKGWVNRLAVDPAYRRQGIGSRLIAAAEEYLGRQGVDVVAALILEENTTSRAVFADAGYQHDPHVLYFSKRSSWDS